MLFGLFVNDFARLLCERIAQSVQISILYGENEQVKLTKASENAEVLG